MKIQILNSVIWCNKNQENVSKIHRISFWKKTVNYAKSRLSLAAAPPPPASDAPVHNWQQTFTYSSLITNTTFHQQVNRVQNSRLFQQYVTRKASMAHENGRMENEKRLWHGTGKDALNNILTNNFNRSYSGVHGLYYFYPLE